MPFCRCYGVSERAVSTGGQHREHHTGSGRQAVGGHPGPRRRSGLRRKDGGAQRSEPGSGSVPSNLGTTARSILVLPAVSVRERHAFGHGVTVTQMVTHHGPDMSVTALIYDEAPGWLVSLIPCSQNRIRDLGGSALIAQCPKR